VPIQAMPAIICAQRSRRLSQSAMKGSSITGHFALFDPIPSP
jgi:hypothetical protein